MTHVLLAVDVELDLALFELLAGVDEVTVVARPADEVELLAYCRTGSADVVVVGQYFSGLDAEVIAAIGATGTKILGFGNDAEALEDLGVARSVPSNTDPSSMRMALDEILSSTVVPPRPPEPPGAGGGIGRIVAVWGTGSSPGRTVTAVNLGDHGSRQGHTTVVVDADTVSASLATTLGLMEESSHLASLCRLEAQKRPPLNLDEVPHAEIRENFHAITGLTRADRWPELRASAVSAVLKRLAKLYDLVVVDIADRIDPDDDLADPYYDRHNATRAVLETADVVIVLAAGDPIGLQKLVKLLDTERAERIRAKVTIAITKVRQSAVGKPAEGRIREVLDRFVNVEPDFILNDDRPTLDAALLAGKTLHETNPKSVLSHDIAEVVTALLPSRARSRRSSVRGRRRVKP